MRKRKGLPGLIENGAYDAIRHLLDYCTNKKNWMSTDQILGAAESGVNRAMAEFKTSRERRRHGRD
jgi:transposase-like protein